MKTNIKYPFKLLAFTSCLQSGRTSWYMILWKTVHRVTGHRQEDTESYFLVTRNNVPHIWLSYERARSCSVLYKRLRRFMRKHFKKVSLISVFWLVYQGGETGHLITICNSDLPMLWVWLHLSIRKAILHLSWIISLVIRGLYFRFRFAFNGTNLVLRLSTLVLYCSLSSLPPTFSLLLWSLIWPEQEWSWSNIAVFSATLNPW